MSGFCANTNILECRDLKAELDGTAINDATVTVTVKDFDGVELAGATWPRAMNYIPGSEGNYRVYFSEALPFQAKQSYIAFIDADGGANRFGHFEFHFKPLVRAAQDAA